MTTTTDSRKMFKRAEKMLGMTIKSKLDKASLRESKRAIKI